MQGDTSITICNRAMQKAGANSITSLNTSVDTSKEAQQCAIAYEPLRRFEMRRNVWRFATRRTPIRPVGTPVQGWSSTTTYAQGAIVSYGTGSGVNYISLQNSNLNQNPATAGTYWAVYNGSTTMAVTFPTWSSGNNYSIGAIVVGSDGYTYLALKASTSGSPVDPSNVDANSATWAMYFGPTTASCFDPNTSYFTGELVFEVTNPANVFACLFNGNSNDPVSSGVGWLALSGATTAALNVPWPAGTGPQTQSTTNNVYVLPNGFLREAPQAPKAGSQSIIGAPTNMAYDDWVFEGNYLITRYGQVIVLRFVADVRDASQFDSMFCEGFACRIAFELAEQLTNSNTKLSAIGAQYKQWMGEARTVNGIEEGPTEAPLDDWIATRI